MEAFEGQYFSENSLKLTMMRKPKVRMSLLETSSNKRSRFFRVQFADAGATLAAIAQYLAEISLQFCIADVDLSHFKKDKTVFMACYDSRAFDRAKTLLFQHFSPNSRIDGLQDIASFEYADLVLVVDSSSLEDDQIKQVFLQFGDVHSIERAALGKYIVRYFDCRSLAKIEQYKRLKSKSTHNHSKLTKQEEFILMKSHPFTESNWISVYFHLINPYRLRLSVNDSSGIDKENKMVSSIIRRGKDSQEVDFLKDVTNQQLSLFSSVKQHMENNAISWNTKSKDTGGLEKNTSKTQVSNSQIDLNYMEVDGRCSLMIKNIPNSVLVKEFIDIVNRDFEGLYDFIYLPIDFKNKCNLGYAFINLLNTQAARSFTESFEGKSWKHKSSSKVCSLRYATFQGRNQMLMNFRRGGVFKTAQQMWRASESSLDFLPEYCDFLPRVMPNQAEDKGIF